MGGGGGGGGTTKVRAVRVNENNKAPRIGALAGARSVVALEGEDGPSNAPGVKTRVGASAWYCYSGQCWGSTQNINSGWCK